MSNTKKKTTEEFIRKAKQVHGEKYDYSKVEYVNQLTKVCIVCPEHGEFWQAPKSHLMGHGCKLCGNDKCSAVNKGRKKAYIHRKKYNNELFKIESKKIHGDEYDYSKVEYKNNSTPVCIICTKHGEFWQRPYDHIDGKSGCPKCANEKRHNFFVEKKENFIKKSTLLFLGKYSYTKVDYYNNSTKVIITCPTHGDFLCSPNNHLKGRGCPVCKAELYVYENRLYVLLLTIFKKDDIKRQYKDDWLTNNKSLDFFMPKYNIAVEHQGEQHVKPIEIFGGIEKFNRTRELDIEKNNECKNMGINLLYFSYQQNVDFSGFIDNVFLNENIFIEKIKEIINNL